MCAKFQVNVFQIDWVVTYSTSTVKQSASPRLHSFCLKSFSSIHPETVTFKAKCWRLNGNFRTSLTVICCRYVEAMFWIHHVFIVGPFVLWSWQAINNWFHEHIKLNYFFDICAGKFPKYFGGYKAFMITSIDIDRIWVGTKMINRSF